MALLNGLITPFPSALEWSQTWRQVRKMRTRQQQPHEVPSFPVPNDHPPYPFIFWPISFKRNSKHHYPGSSHVQFMDARFPESWWKLLCNDVGRGHTIWGPIEEVQEVETNESVTTRGQRGVHERRDDSAHLLPVLLTSDEDVLGWVCSALRAFKWEGDTPPFDRSPALDWWEIEEFYVSRPVVKARDKVSP